MGGGSSKEKDQTIKPKSANKSETVQQGTADNAFDNYTGPAAKPSLDNNPTSPAKSLSSKPSAAEPDDQEPDD